MLLNITGKLPSFEKIVWVLISLFIIALPGFTRFGKNVFYILFLLAIIYMVRERPKLSSLNKDEKIIFATLITFFLWTLFTFYINGQPGRGHLFIWSRQFFLLSLIPLYFLFRRYPMPQKWLLVTLLIAAVVNFCIAIDDVYLGGSLYGERAAGGVQPILFGSISLLIAVFITSFVLFVKQNKIQVGIAILAVLFLLGVVVLSEARGVWLPIPVILLLVFVVKFNQVEIWKKLMGGIIVFALLSGSYLIPSVKKRVDRTVDNVTSYIITKDIDHSSRHTSLGTRLEMWKAGWRMFLDNPVMGVGLGGYMEVAKSNHKRYEVNRTAYSFYHPHNQYVSEMASKGFPGVLLYVSILILLLRYYWQQQKINKSTRCYSFSGFLIVVSFAIFGLTDSVFEGKATVIYMMVLLAIILAAMSNISRKVDGRK